MANLVAGSTVRFEGDRFLVPGASTEDMRFGAVFSLKAYPASTAPGIFDHFDLDFDSVVTHSFTPIEQFEALARIRRTVRQMGAADDAAASLRGQLIDAADDLASGRIGFGLHHASIAVFARDDEELDEAAAQVRAAGQRVACVLIREDIGARATWFSRTVWITFHCRGITSSVSETSSPSVTIRPEPQQPQAAGLRSPPARAADARGRACAPGAGGAHPARDSAMSRSALVL